MNRRCARAGQYECPSPVVWALTTVLREGWQYACAKHLNQVLGVIADQARVEVVHADRVTEEGGIAVKEIDLAREAIYTAPPQTWHYGHLKSAMEETGLDVSGARCRELLESLADESFITRTGGAGWSKLYVLTSVFKAESGAAERAIGCTSDG
ncbi:hypothetical protein AB0M39_38105 [Streptomyces sp. NPDC051907]|uniref:hypothetical protein n=1 Tax=Streptomyces sp. NPDC051907 TaxID=3155284 RepID=UPI0034308ECC